MITAEDISLEGVDVMFEITRWCNFECSHCMRGERQKRLIKNEYINQTLEQIERIGTMSFTGGEPALAKKQMQYVLDACHHYKTEVGHFWMATNGSITTPSFFDLIVDWLHYCDDGDISGLRVSIDQYHEAEGTIQVSKFKDFEDRLDMEGLNCYLEYQGASSNPKHLVAEGRAGIYYYSAQKMVEHNINLEWDDYDKKYLVRDTLYVSAKGNIITTADISFERMDDIEEDFIVCHVSEDIREGLARWFNSHPERVEKRKEYA